MRRGFFLLALAFVAGCVERDNPFDPVNVPAKLIDRTQPPPIAWIPTPSTHVRVLLEDSAKRGIRSYFGNFMRAMSDIQPGDTLYIYGGGGEYVLSGALRIINKGTLSQPIVIRSFGGRARFRMVQTQDSTYQQYCLQIEDSYVRMVGFSFVGGRQSAIKVGPGLLAVGSIDLDSVDLESRELGIHITYIQGPVRIHNMVIRNVYQNVIPMKFIGVANLDTSNIYW